MTAVINAEVVWPDGKDFSEKTTFKCFSSLFLLVNLLIALTIVPLIKRPSNSVFAGKDSPIDQRMPITSIIITGDPREVIPSKNSDSR